MPELPEVEALVRHLSGALPGKVVTTVATPIPKVVRPGSAGSLRATVAGCRIQAITRRAKYLVIDLIQPTGASTKLLAHLGMTGRMYLESLDAPLARHAAVVFNLGGQRLVFEDARRFGRVTLDAAVLDNLGPEPLGPGFTTTRLWEQLNKTRRPVKVALLDQAVAAGVGNIYACEALHQAGLSPERRGIEITRVEAARLQAAIADVLSRAIEAASRWTLDFRGGRDGLFYYGSSVNEPGSERFAVYDRAGEPCPRCAETIRRVAQAGRGAYYCPACQR